MKDHASPFDVLVALFCGALLWFGGFCLGQARGRRVGGRHVITETTVRVLPRGGSGTAPPTRRPAVLIEGRETKSLNPPNTSTARPPAPGGSRPRQRCHYLVRGPRGSVAPWRDGPLCDWSFEDKRVLSQLSADDDASADGVDCPECLRMLAERTAAR